MYGLVWIGILGLLSPAYAAAIPPQETSPVGSTSHTELPESRDIESNHTSLLRGFRDSGGVFLVDATSWLITCTVTRLFFAIRSRAAQNPVVEWGFGSWIGCSAAPVFSDPRATTQLYFSLFFLECICLGLYALSLFKTITRRMSLLLLVLSGTFVVGGFLCKLASPSQGVDQRLLGSFLFTVAWLSLTALHIIEKGFGLPQFGILAVSASTVSVTEV